MKKNFRNRKIYKKKKRKRGTNNKKRSYEKISYELKKEELKGNTLFMIIGLENLQEKL